MLFKSTWNDLNFYKFNFTKIKQISLSDSHYSKQSVLIFVKMQIIRFILINLLFSILHNFSQENSSKINNYKRIPHNRNYLNIFAFSKFAMTCFAKNILNLNQSYKSLKP